MSELEWRFSGFVWIAWESGASRCPADYGDVARNTLGTSRMSRARPDRITFSTKLSLVPLAPHLFPIVPHYFYRSSFL